MLSCSVSTGTTPSCISPSSNSKPPKKTQFHRISEDNIERFKEAAVKKLVPLIDKLTSLVESDKNSDKKHSAPSFALKAVLKNLDKVKTETLGKRKGGGWRGEGKPAGAPRAVRRAQTKLDKAAKALVNETNTQRRQELMVEVWKLEKEKSYIRKITDL